LLLREALITKIQTFANLTVIPQRGALVPLRLSEAPPFSPCSGCCVVGNPCGLQRTLVAKLSHKKKLLFREFFAATIGTKNSITNPNPWGFRFRNVKKFNWL
jgi:hypothetical protein